MRQEDDALRNRLLGLETGPADLPQYCARVRETIASDQRRIRRERYATRAFWIFCAASAVAWLWFSAGAAHFPREPFLACIFFAWGGVEMVKHYVNSCRVDLLKEIKQLQLQVFELQEADRGRAGEDAI